MKVIKKDKKERTKIFGQGKKAINISCDIYNLIEEKSKNERLYPSQVIDEILRNYFKKD